MVFNDPMHRRHSANMEPLLSSTLTVQDGDVKFTFLTLKPSASLTERIVMWLCFDGHVLSTKRGCGFNPCVAAAFFLPPPTSVQVLQRLPLCCRFSCSSHLPQDSSAPPTFLSDLRHLLLPSRVSGSSHLTQDSLAPPTFLELRLLLLSSRISGSSYSISRFSCSSHLPQDSLAPTTFLQDLWLLLLFSRVSGSSHFHPGSLY